MPVTKCKDCGQPVSHSANRCPHCGAKNPSTSYLVGFIIFIIAIIVVLKACG